MQTAATPAAPDRAVFDESRILRMHERQVLAMARGFAVEFEDVAQIGRIALLEAARVWFSRPKNTASFWTYAHRCIRHEMLAYHLREVTKRIQLESDAALEQSLLAHHFPLPDDLAILGEALSRAELSEDERGALVAHLEGDDIRTIAERTGVSKSQAHRTLATAMAKLGAQ